VDEGEYAHDRAGDGEAQRPRKDRVTPAPGGTRTAATTPERVSEGRLVRGARWALYLTAAGLPLYVVRWHYGPLPTTLLETLILVTVALYAVARWRDGMRRPVSTAYDIPIIVLLVAGAVSVLVASDHRAALGLYRAYFIEPVALYYVAADLLNREGHMQRVLLALAVGSSAFALINLEVFTRAVLAHDVHVGVAPNALYGNANYVAMYLEPPVALAAGLLFLGRNWRWKLAGAVWLAIVGSALMVMFSKGSYLALAVLAVVALVTVPRWRLPVLAGVAAAVIALTQIPLLQARLATVPSAVNGREEVFGAALGMIRDHPVLGLGLGGYTFLFRGVQPEAHPHDLWLTFWIELGVLGLIAFTVILFGLLWRGWRAWPKAEGFSRPLLWGVLGALVLWTVHGLVDSPYWKNDMSAEFWILAAVEVVMLRTIAGKAAIEKDPQVNRVAVINDVAGMGRLQARVLNEAGYSADFIELPKPGARWSPFVKLLIMPLRLAMYLPVIGQVRRIAYDWLHIHFASQGFIGVLAGKPFFVHAHGADLHINLTNPLLRWVSRLAMQKATAIFYVTPELLQYLTEFRSKSYLLPNPLEPAFFEEISLPPSLRKILIFTRLYPIKGPEEIFEATPELSELVSLTAVSWGPLSARLSDRYRKFVTFINRVPHEQIPSMVDGFDAVIGQMRLGILSLSELESMARGRVVFMHLDRSLYMDDPPPVVDVADAAGLVAAVRRLQQDPAEMSRLARAGREWVARHHSAENYLRILRGVYATSGLPLSPVPGP
jgi:O-antigen ligase